MKIGYDLSFIGGVGIKILYAFFKEFFKLAKGMKGDKSDKGH